MDLIVCSPKALPDHLLVHGAKVATEVNRMNAPVMRGIAMLGTPTPSDIAALTAKYWGTKGVKLSVGFMDTAASELIARILQHMNAWGQYGNVKFMLSNTSPQVRIARTPGDGYWSYLGTDILSIPSNQPTMNLDSFTMNTPESEYHRVVRHETGHTLGFPHEHMRADIVARIDPRKATVYFERTQGWTAQEIQQQVLTPIDEALLIPEAGQTRSDTSSIMTYQLPGSIMKDGIAVPGGTDIDPRDQAFAALIYPLEVVPPPPAPPPVQPPPPPVNPPPPVVNADLVIRIHGGVPSIDGYRVSKLG